MEKNHPDFPRHGKKWPEFSTVWKKVFHTVENPGPVPAGCPDPHGLAPWVNQAGIPPTPSACPAPRAPVLMGILNLTPDSFSDGGQFLDPSAALDQALKLEADGAHILDVGAESTRPGHDSVSAGEELRRLLPVLDRLAGRLKIPVSIDTSKAAVARAAFDHGAVMLNDVAALSRPGMAEFARAGEFPIVLMHGVAHQLAEDDARPSETIAAWLAARVRELDLDPARLILDPGIGFGTTRPQDAAILDHLSPLVSLGFPVLVGLSRKRIVRTLHPDADPDEASARMALQAWQNGAAILRLHDVRLNQLLQQVNSLVATIDFPGPVQSPNHRSPLDHP
jgi:dihydropteroate synthase